MCNLAALQYVVRGFFCSTTNTCSVSFVDSQNTTLEAVRPSMFADITVIGVVMSWMFGQTF